MVKSLGLNCRFLYKLVDTVVDIYSDTYPELEENKEKITDIIKKEEERFKQTIERGESLLNDIIEKALSTTEKQISGENAFKLYDTFGFPLELTVETASEKGITVDIDGFIKYMEEQKERAKKAQATVRLNR